MRDGGIKKVSQQRRGGMSLPLIIHSREFSLSWSNFWIIISITFSSATSFSSFRFSFLHVRRWIMETCCGLYYVDQSNAKHSESQTSFSITTLVMLMRFLLFPLFCCLACIALVCPYLLQVSLCHHYLATLHHHYLP